MEDYEKAYGSLQGASMQLNKDIAKLIKTEPQEAHLIRQAARELNRDLTKDLTT